MVWPFAPPDDGSVWQHGQAPPLFFSQKARMTARLSAPLFPSTAFYKVPYQIIAHPAPSLDDSFIMSDDRRRVKLAVDKLFRCGRLTVKQKERFVRHFFAGVSLRKIASDEGVHFTSVDESIRRAVDKLRTYFNEVK